MSPVVDHLRDRWEPTFARSLPWCPPAVPTLVVVPHPDDEVLLAGDLVGHQRDLGVPVTVLAVTDGEAVYPDVDRVELGRRRRCEQLEALDVLGVEAADVVRLGLPDSGVAADDPVLLGTLAGLLPRHGLVVAPFPDEGHRDHDACGDATVAVARSVGTAVIHGLFWTWHNREPDDLDNWEVLQMAADPAARRRRQRALACHASQVDDVVATPLLGTAELAPARWPDLHLVRRAR